MGLSNNERFEKIAYSITNIVSQTRNLKDDYTYSRLKNLVEELWPAFLGKSSNSLFWITGGGFDVSHFSENSLLCLAFKENQPREDEDSIYGQDEDGVKYNDSIESRKTVGKMLKLETLINDRELASVVEIHQWAENLSYALCRYDDSFSKNLWPLNKIVRKIQGELFDIIRGDSNFYRAWLLTNIVKKCVNLWDDDVVSKWIRHQNVQHNLRLMNSREHKLEDLQAVYFDLQPHYVRDVPIEKRMFILLALCGRRYHYDHEFKQLKKWVEQHNEKSDEKINLDKLQEIFYWCQEQKKIYDEEEKYETYCELSGQKV